MQTGSTFQGSSSSEAESGERSIPRLGDAVTRVLSGHDCELFIQRGFVHVRQAFPRSAALDVVEHLWEQLHKTQGVKRDDRSTWKEPWGGLGSKHIHFERFRPCETPRLRQAVDELAGAAGWDGRPGWGSCPVNFHLGSHKPWTVSSEGWHWDCTSFGEGVVLPVPSQALLAFPHFSDVEHRGGGTLLLEGSHILSTRFFHDISADGRHRLRGAAMRGEFERLHPWLAELCGQRDFQGDRVMRFMTEGVDLGDVRLRVHEITAQAGDVFLCHPFMYHAASPNHSRAPRFMCNGRIRAARGSHPMFADTALGRCLRRSLPDLVE